MPLAVEKGDSDHSSDPDPSPSSSDNEEDSETEEKRLRKPLGLLTVKMILRIEKFKQLDLEGMEKECPRLIQDIKLLEKGGCRKEETREKVIKSVLECLESKRKETGGEGGSSSSKRKRQNDEEETGKRKEDGSSSGCAIVLDA